MDRRPRCSHSVILPNKDLLNEITRNSLAYNQQVACSYVRAVQSCERRKRLIPRGQTLCPQPLLFNIELLNLYSLISNHRPATCEVALWEWGCTTALAGCRFVAYCPNSPLLCVSSETLLENNKCRLSLLETSTLAPLLPVVMRWGFIFGIHLYHLDW